MTNKNLPDTTSDKKKDKANNPSDTHKPEMGSSRALNQGGNSGSHPEANDERRELTRKSDSAVPNPGRDITTGSDGFDGQGRERAGDQGRSTTNAERTEKKTDRDNPEDAVQNDQRKVGSKGNKA